MLFCQPKDIIRTKDYLNGVQPTNFDHDVPFQNKERLFWSLV